MWPRLLVAFPTQYRLDLHWRAFINSFLSHQTNQPFMSSLPHPSSPRLPALCSSKSVLWGQPLPPPALPRPHTAFSQVLSSPSDFLWLSLRDLTWSWTNLCLNLAASIYLSVWLWVSFVTSLNLFYLTWKNEHNTNFEGLLKIVKSSGNYWFQQFYIIVWDFYFPHNLALE